MRLAIRLLGPVLLLSVLAVGCSSQPAASPAPAAAATQISIKGFAFNPNQPSLTKGATITWTNDDGTTHTVTSGIPGTPSGKFNQSLDAGKTFSFTFTEPGTYEFFCNIHNSMRGTVTVK
jgi:plastocyanin